MSLSRVYNNRVTPSCDECNSLPSAKPETADTERDRETQPSFEATVCADGDFISAAEVIEKSIVSIQIQKDGVGLKSTNLQVIVRYETTWPKVNSMSISNGILFISQRQGISKIELETCQSRLGVTLVDQPCVLTSFGTEILDTNQKKASVWQLNGDGGDLRLFAGSESKDGSSDGPVKGSRFKQSVGICTEFGSIMYVCDAQTNSIKNCTKLKECAQFLKAIGCLYEAFSVHNKGACYTVKSAD